MKLNRRAFVKLGVLFVPALLLTRKSLGQFASFRDLAFMGPKGGSPFSAQTNDWANRVVANGDPRPSNAILTAVDTWYKALVSGGVDTQIITASFCAPGGTLITMGTPFFKVAGLDPYTIPNGGSMVADGVNGIKAVANPVSVLTGVDPHGVFSASDMGLSIYAKNSGAPPAFAFGGGDGTHTAGIWCDGGGDNQVASYACWDITFTQPFGADTYGFHSANRTASNSTIIYCANSSVAWASKGSSANAGTLPNAGGSIGINGTGICATIGGGTKWYSFLCVHHGLTSGQGQTLFNATQTLRQAFSGGFS